MFTYSQVSGGLRLDYTLGDQQSLDDVAWGMLSNNDIVGIQPVRRSQLDNRVVLHYDIAGQSTLREVISRPLRRSDVVWILGSIVGALTSAESYMITPDRFVLDPELVFVDPVARTVSLICLPVSTGLPSDPLSFFKKVIFDIRFDEREDSSYAGELVASLNARTSLDLGQFAKAIRSVEMRSAVPAMGGAPQALGSQNAPPLPTGPMPTSDQAGGWALASAPHSPFAPASPMPGPPMAGSPMQAPPMPAPTAPAPAHPVPSTVREPQQAHVPAPLPRPQSAVSAVTASPQAQRGGDTLGFSVPGRPAHLPAQPAQMPALKGPKVHGKVPTGSGDEPSVSLLYLLQHYSKENKELYDRQRQARAALKAASKSQPAPAGVAPPVGAGHPPVPPSHQQQVGAAMAPGGGGPSPYPGGGSVPVTPGPHGLQHEPSMHGMDVPDGFGETVYFGGLGAAAGLEAARRAGDQASSHASQGAGLVPPPPDAGSLPLASLRNSLTGEVVRIEKQVFVIGRRRSGVDYVLRDRTVSNSHAIIYANADGYSIIDNNSLNGVFVNGHQIVPVQRVALPPEAEIRIGDEVVYFRLDR